jgi:hypothetical protein
VAGESSQRRVVGERRGRRVDPEPVAHAGEHLLGLKGVAAERDEVVVASDRIEAEDLRPDLGERALGAGVRFHMCGAPRRGGQRATVDLAAFVAGKYRQQHDPAGHHPRRQRVAQFAAQVRLGRRAFVRGGGDVTDERDDHAVAVRGDHRIVHTGQ